MKKIFFNMCPQDSFIEDLDDDIDAEFLDILLLFAKFYFVDIALRPLKIGMPTSIVDCCEASGGIF